MLLLDPIRVIDHVRGPLSARIRLVEYGDFECPFCALAAPVLQQVERRYAGDIAIVFRHSPRAFDHPHAKMAAEVAEAAGAQGKFWEMHDLLFENQQHLELDDFLAYAERLKLDCRAFQAALEGGTYRQRVHEDELSGTMNRVISTPSLFINTVPYRGPFEVEALSYQVSSRLDE